VQFDGEKPDKITRDACACNDDKVIFENPLNWTTRSFIFAKQREYENGPATPEPSGETIVRGRDRGKRKEAELYARTQVTGKANFSPGITSGLPVTRTQWLPNQISPSKMQRSGDHFTDVATFNVDAITTEYAEIGCCFLKNTLHSPL
jgi:hypothetical protein